MDIAILHRPATSLQATPVRHRSVHHRTKVSGQSLAKADRDPCELEVLAAKWVLGSLTIDPPTIALAAKVFNVSPAPIRTAINELRNTTVAEPAINSVWLEMTEFDREEFVRKLLAEIWEFIEHVTR